ncbi:homeobox-domain-containing protein [Thelephora ganbajun]|uniref:Homeobox-domain-containing protein n=1 Tax=Thelephora ganbajun TaxID=370292 RepID=A0ACB6ZVB6_THEGA|nr:homeobox-domain-containing protein [Thelephora ganbajun]
MSPTSPARDSHSPPVPIPPDTSSSLPYSSRPERTPNSQGTSPVDPSATISVPHPTSSPLVSSLHQHLQQQQAEPGISHAPSPPSASTSPRHRPFEASQDRRMHSPSSSSQGDAADTEMESGPSSSQLVGQHQPQDLPPKKKRTRTLTTPHQSAVLHALLAQSRFPTTAMREEVGRQIGLSARKVQIWFQNQRQKARRPQGQNASPQRLDRPPQFGPFLSYPLPAHSTGPQSTSAGSVHDPHWSSPLAIPGRPDAYPRPSILDSPLESGGPSDVHPRRAISPGGGLPHLPISPTRRLSLATETRHPRLNQLQGREPPQQEESLDLPPLVQTGLPSPSSDHPPTGLPSLRDVPSFRRSLTGLPPTSPTTTLPPPFTMEPQPQWEPETVLPITSAWRGPNYTTSPNSRRLSSDSFPPNFELTRSPEPERTPRQSESHAGGRVPNRSTAARFDPIRSSRNNSLPSPSRSSHPRTSAGRRHSDDPQLNDP